ncbi:hypothetical protein E9228_001565 [Curtobacterium flaccumfaciens]|uniref:Bacterial Ig domain-containing protein n=1 Tax=Curtobacterium salicis TaxID=1779862 RepID=A0ABX0T9T6_9MICO|nr:Ig-like domain-containing protein [Curtobacterium sp. WW7]NII40929.1 hypothetical protein [Curtobacterium sp. WW7]
MSKKNTVAKLGAGVLAAATVMSGLSFGVMPAGAATETQASSAHQYEVGDKGATLQLIAKTDSGYSYLADATPADEVRGNRSADTLEEAKQNAAVLTAHFSKTVDGRDYWQLRTTSPEAGPKCLLVGIIDGTPVTSLNRCSTNPWFDFTAEKGTIRARQGVSYGVYVTSDLNWTRRGTFFSNESSAPEDNTFVGMPTTLEGLTADVQDVNVEAGTARLDGVATSETTSVDISYTDKNKRDRVFTADAADGKWTHQLTDLALGKTTVHLTAYNGAETVAENDIEVDLPVTPLTVDAQLSTTNVAMDAELVGTATRDTTVNAWDGDRKVASGMSKDDGSFRMEVDAPNRAGDWDLRVTQEIRKEQATEQAVTIGYGEGVSIASPADGSELDPGSRLVVSGKAQAGSIVQVYERDKPKVVLGQMTATNGYRITLNGLEDREYDLVVSALSKGNNVTTAEVTINPGKSDVTAPTATVSFDEDDLSAKATVSGTGAAGATITVKDEHGKTLGTTTVSGTTGTGNWSLPIDPIGPGKHTLTIEQTGIEGTQTATAEADFGAAVSLHDAGTFANGSMDVTGTSSEGAQVSITTGGKTIDTFEVTNEDGTFARTLEGLGSGAIQLTATAKSKGGLVTSDSLTAESPVKVEDLTVASHVRGGTFVPGPQTFTGHATAGTTVTLNPFGFEDKYAAYNLTTTTDQFGEWTITRGLSDTPYKLISFKQTAQRGVVNEILDYNLKPFKEIGEPGDLQFTNFKAGDFFNPGDQVFTGRATPGATVTLNPFGFDPRYAAYDLTTTADLTTGAWEIRRGLADTVYRELAVKQDPATDGKVNKIEHVTVAANGWVGAPANLVLKTPGNTFTPGEQTFSGTATAGTTVTLYPFGDDKYAEIKMTTKVDATGKWEIKRNLGNQVFPTVITQTEQDGKVNRVTHTMTPAS